MQEDNDACDAIAEAERWLGLRAECQATETPAQIRDSRLAEVHTDQRRLTELVKADRCDENDYALRSIETFGLPGQTEDDIFVVAGDVAFSCDTCPGSHRVDLTDVYVRLGDGYQRLVEKSMVSLGANDTEGPGLASLFGDAQNDTVSLEAGSGKGDAAPDPARQSTIRQELAAWALGGNVFFDLLTIVVIGSLTLGNAMRAAGLPVWPGIMLIILAVIDFGRTLPRLWWLTSRIEGRAAGEDVLRRQRS